MVVQWLGSCAFTTANLISIPSRELRSFKPHCAAKKKIIIKDFSSFFLGGSLLSYNICVCVCVCVCVRERGKEGNEEQKRKEKHFVGLDHLFFLYVFIFTPLKQNK